MNGLDAILNRIISDAEERALEIKEQTQQRCLEILKTAELEAARLLAVAARRAEEESAVLLRRAQSLSTLETRKRILSARQKLIDDVINQAETSLSRLGIHEKAELYTRLLLDNARGNETVVFSRNEQAFAVNVLEAVNKAMHWQLTLANEPGTFDTGVVLQQGLIETNLTTGLLVRSMRPELVSLAARILFGS